MAGEIGYNFCRFNELIDEGHGETGEMLGVVFLYGDRGSDGIHGSRKPDARRGVAGASSGADAEDAIDCCMLVCARHWCEWMWVWKNHGFGYLIQRRDEK